MSFMIGPSTSVYWTSKRPEVAMSGNLIFTVSLHRRYNHPTTPRRQKADPKLTQQFEGNSDNQGNKFSSESNFIFVH